MRSIDTLLDNYTGDHLNPRNQLIHLICVPAIVWSVSAALWVIPVPAILLKPGAWTALAMFAAWMYYWRLSRTLAMGIFFFFLAAILLDRWLFDHYGGAFLLELGVGVFVVAWIGQFIGHHIEGKRPSFLTDMVYLLIGPLWTLSKFYRRFGIEY
jgi:uncharacterized membrane protein YGL010W